MKDSSCLLTLHPARHSRLLPRLDERSLQSADHKIKPSFSKMVSSSNDMVEVRRGRSERLLTMKQTSALRCGTEIRDIGSQMASDVAAV